MSGPVETELPPTAFCRKDKLRLSLQRSISSSDGEDDLKSRVRSIDSNELARKLNSTKHNRYNFLLLDCRGLLCYSNLHIRGAVHIACTDRFNRKRVQNGSVLDLVSTNNRRNKSNGQWTNGKWRDVIVYDDGISDLNLEANWSNPISFVLAHLIQENRQPIYLTGGIQEFSRYYKDLCDSCGSRKDLSLSSLDSLSPTSGHFPHFPSALLLPPISISPPPAVTTPMCFDSYENEPPTQVLPYLYVGNARDANDQDLLRKLGIRFVLSVTTTIPHSHSYHQVNTAPSTNENSNSAIDSDEESGTRTSEFRTKLIPVSDNLCENLAPYFEDACDFIEEARTSGTKVLIHCQAGISRSPTIAIAYIMKSINLSALEAYAFVQRKRRIISPNLNFMGQLVEFESKLKGFASLSDSSCTTSTSSTNSDCSSVSDSLTTIPVLMITD